MWTRRIDLNIAEPLANGYRYGEGQKFFEKRIVVVPEASPGLKKVAANRLQWLNGQMDDKREYICGKRFTLADILLYCWLEFGNQVGQPLDPANANIVAWLARVGAAAEREGLSPPLSSRISLACVHFWTEGTHGALLFTTKGARIGRNVSRQHRRGIAGETKWTSSTTAPGRTWTSRWKRFARR